MDYYTELNRFRKNVPETFKVTDDGEGCTAIYEMLGYTFKITCIFDDTDEDATCHISFQTKNGRDLKSEYDVRFENIRATLQLILDSKEVDKPYLKNEILR